jgi:ATP-dependent helicase/DNAse subunit B
MYGSEQEHAATQHLLGAEHSLVWQRLLEMVEDKSHLFTSRQENSDEFSGFACM